jgi:hypothetical protein
MKKLNDLCSILRNTERSVREVKEKMVLEIWDWTLSRSNAMFVDGSGREADSS